jgi:Ca2+-binding EF-hand superfamily protein
MNRDSISMKEDGRKAYLEYLETMHSAEKKIVDKHRKSLLSSTAGDNDSILYDDIFDPSAGDLEHGLDELTSPSSPTSPRLRRQSSANQSIDSDDRPSYGRTSRSSGRHASFSLDDYYHEREINEHKKEHLDEIINQLPLHRQLLFHLYALWLRLTKCCSSREDDMSGRRSSFSDADINLDRKASPDRAETIDRQRRLSGAHRALSVSKRVFLFGSSKLYYRIVEIGLLFQCFYISIWATQLMPLARHSENRNYWIPALTLPVIFNILLVGMTLHCSVMLKAVIELNPDIVGTVCEECIQEQNVIKDLQARVREKLSDSNTPRRLWKVFVRDQFLEFDVNHDGSLDQLEFREFLGSLDIFMGKRHFDILWEAIDIDLSNAITWDELFVIVFPEFKYDIREELKVVETIQRQFKSYFQQQKIPKLKYLSTIQEIFSKYDSKGTNSLTKSELWALLKDLGIQGLSKKMFQLLVLSMDHTGEGNDILFNEFVRVIFGSELATIASSERNTATSYNRSSLTSGGRVSINFNSSAMEIKTRRRSSHHSHRYDDLSSFVPFAGIIHPDSAVDSNADPALPRLNPVVGGYKRISTYEMVEMAKKNKEMIAHPSRPSRTSNSSRMMLDVDGSPNDTEKTVDTMISPAASSSFIIDKTSHTPADEVKENHHKSSSPINMLFDSAGHENYELHQEQDESILLEEDLDRRQSIVLDDSGPALTALLESMRLEELSVRERRCSIDV